MATHPGYLPVFLWSLVILASFWGWGEALRRVLNRREFEDLGWGLTMAWGMAVTLACGGLLMAFSAAKAPALTALVLLGAALGFSLVVPAWREKSKSARLEKKEARRGKPDGTGSQSSHSQLTAAGVSALIFLAALACLAFASSIAWPHQIDPNDDLVCYLMLPEKILGSGTLIEPFSFQRAGAYGGQALLQALVYIVGTEVNGHVPERGFAMALLFGIYLHAARNLPSLRRWAGFLLLFAFLFVPVPRISTNGAMTGGLLVVSMLATLDRVASAPSFRGAIPVGLAAAGAAAIKAPYAFHAFLVLSAAFLPLIFLRGGRPGFSAPHFKLLLTSAVVIVVVLAPYAAVLTLSNGAPMIPPFTGWVSEAYRTFSFKDLAMDLQAMAAFAAAPQSIAIWGLYLALAICGAPAAVLPPVLATLGITALMLYKFSAIAYLDQYRYLYPILVPVALWLLVKTLRPAERQSGRAGKSAALPKPVVIAAALLVFIVVNFPQGFLELREQIADLPRQIRERREFFDPRLRQAYREIQSLVPPGEAVLTMADAGFMFDFSRNPLFSINAVGGSSPPPGLPFGQGSGRLREYLLGLGLKYLIAVDFHNAVLLYTRRLWTTHTRPEWFYHKLWKPRFNDFMDSVDTFEAEGRVIARRANLRLFRLD